MGGKLSSSLTRLPIIFPRAQNHARDSVSREFNLRQTRHEIAGGKGLRPSPWVRLIQQPCRRASTPRN